MKKYQYLLLFSFTVSFIALMNGCKKDNIAIPNSVYIEEFENVYKEVYQKGWATKNGTNYWTWGQGQSGTDKSGNVYGFPAYSYNLTSDEYAYSGLFYPDTSISISNWLITPQFSIHNGSKISFYTRGDFSDSVVSVSYTNRMQVRMSITGANDIGDSINDVGSFTTTLIDINPTQAPGGYPSSWTKYEYTFSGIDGTIYPRIAFRHYLINPTNARGIGVDLFKLE